MAQTKDGAIKAAAKKAGLSIEEFLARREAGLKKCTICKKWKSLDNFCIDRSRGDGLSAKCVDCRTVDNPYASTKGRSSVFKGRHHTDQAKQLMRLAKKGKSSPKKGIPRTEAEKATIKAGVLKTQKYGVNHPNYIDGRSDENILRRKDSRYKTWRTAVFERDYYTCQDCGDNRGGNLQAHHIKPWGDCPELRFDVSNGLTLCIECHRKVHYGSKY